MNKKVHNLFEIEIFCNIIYVFTITFDLFNVPLLNSVVVF